MPTAVNRKAGTLRFVHGGPNHRQRLGCAPRGGKGSSESTTNGGVHMSKRFLMRLGKTPFEVFDGFDTLDRNTIGRNNGNLIFGMAAHKLFSTAGTVVDANRYKINGAMAAKVNDEYDGFILPLANAFRPGFEAELARTTDFIEKLTIPFLMLSGGAQLPLDGDPAALKKIEPTVRRFAKAVLEKSSALTVRGELTAEYLRSLGFKDVIVVGCPSMTMNGRGHLTSSLTQSRTTMPRTCRRISPLWNSCCGALVPIRVMIGVCRWIGAIRSSWRRRPSSSWTHRSGCAGWVSSVFPSAPESTEMSQESSPVRPASSSPMTVGRSSCRDTMACRPST